MNQHYHNKNVLYYGRESHDSRTLYHWKYTKRKWMGDRWKYWYDDVTSDIKKTASNIANAFRGRSQSQTIQPAQRRTVQPTTSNSLKRKGYTGVASVDSTVQKPELTLKQKIEKGVNTAVKKVKEGTKEFFNNTTNLYDVSRANYKEKIEKIKETPEWKDIVARQDPEYVKKNEDGTVEYKIDDYLTKKKHPVLDALDDIVSGRQVSLHAVTKDSTIAGLKDYAMGTIQMGMIAVGALTKGMQARFKLQQGSYDDEIDEFKATAERGAQYCSQYAEQAQSIDTQAAMKAMQTIGNSAASAAKKIDEDRIVSAAQYMSGQTTATNDSEYQQMQQTLANMSEEEIRALRLLLTK